MSEHKGGCRDRRNGGKRQRKRGTMRLRVDTCVWVPRITQERRGVRYAVGVQCESETGER